MLYQGRGNERTEDGARNSCQEGTKAEFHRGGVITQEAGKNTTVIKGRFAPTITSEAKEKLWISITKSVNSINGKGDSEWRDVRKKLIYT